MKREIKYLEKSKLYSEELGIDLKTGKEIEIFKWFLASILFGKPIQENVAIKTYKEFERRNVLSQEAILKVGWNGLVEILDAGGYVRYDFSTATKLLEIMKALKEKYGTLNELHKQAEDSKDLEAKLQEFKGIGVVTTNIFLRELRPFWKKANPEPLPAVKKIARKYRINLNKYDRKSIAFARIEAGLVRLRKNYLLRSS